MTEPGNTFSQLAAVIDVVTNGSKNSIPCICERGSRRAEATSKNQNTNSKHDKKKMKIPGKFRAREEAEPQTGEGTTKAYGKAFPRKSRRKGGGNPVTHRVG